MARFILSLMELGVSAAVHLIFGFYVFSTAVAADISQAAAASGCLLLRRPPPPPSGEGALVDVAAVGERDERRGAGPVVLDRSPPPIVLVHGIFGFGKGVRNPKTLSLFPLFCASGRVGRCSVKCRGGSFAHVFSPHLCFLTARRGSGGSPTSPAPRRRTTACSCRIWGRSPASMTGGWDQEKRK
jgi:pimeloyl-ACP methyl ester carboxylesterase